MATVAPRTLYVTLVTLATLAALAVLCAAPAHGQLYKWKDARGVTHYTDTPPPDNRPARTVSAPTAAVTGPALPAELAQAAARHPVTLYTTTACDACRLGRALLAARGIPYREKTVDSAADHAVLKAAGSDGQLPLLRVGGNKQIGFEQATWDGLLTDAGYPAGTLLPPGYRQAPATPAAPPADAAAANAGAEQALPAKPLPPINAPPNFQF